MSRWQRFCDWFWHRVSDHRRIECPHCKATTWHIVDSVNPIHPEGPPLWFSLTCLVCNQTRQRSSGLMESAGERMVQRGEIREERKEAMLDKIFPPEAGWKKAP